MKSLFSTIIFYFCCSTYLQSAEIVLVYPRNENDKPFTYTDGIDSTFVLGRVIPPNGFLIINSTRVFYDTNGAFLAYLPLLNKDIENAWNLHLQDGNDTLAQLNFPYKIKDNSDLDFSQVYSNIDSNRFIKVTAKNANIKTSLFGSYFIFPEPNSIIRVLGQSNAFYKIRITDCLNGWIDKNSVEMEDGYNHESPIIGNGVCIQSNSSANCSFKTSKPILWSTTLSESGRSLNLLLYDSKSAIERIKYDVKSTLVDDIVWNQISEGVQIEIRCNKVIYSGYEVSQSNDSITVRIRTANDFDRRGLSNKVIVLDPGHGGAAKGSIGPMGTMEKDAALSWAKVLKPMLERSGAIVKMTRNDDTTLGLYDRVDFAKRENADFFLSLHFNALPDGENPYVRNGSGTYYYQSSSRFAARILQSHLLEKSHLRDDGLYDASFAVIRPTDFPAVLVEAAYIIYPDEEKLINSNKFLTDISEAMTDGLKEYFKLYP